MNDNLIDYEIKYGILKGMKVSEAFKKKKYKELYELRDYLVKNFSKQEKKIKEKITKGIVAIDIRLLKQYSILLNEFYKKFNSLTKEEKSKIKIENEIFETNNVLGIQNIISQIDNVKTL